MLVLGLKILIPLLSFVSGLLIRRKSVSAVLAAVALAVVSVTALVAEHINQAATVSEARQARQRIEESAAEAVALMRERDPDLTAQEALDRVVEELRELHERSADLEDQLTGLKTYSDVAELNVLGDPGTAGLGLRYSSALTRALEGSWDERDGQLYPRCDQTSLAKFSAVARSHPTFPFAAFRPFRLRF